MRAIKKAENQLAGLFKNLPALPESSKESLVKTWPWIALVFGVIQLIVALGLWAFVRTFERSLDNVNSLNIYIGGQSAALTSFDKTVIYLGLLMLIADAIILLMAYGSLRKRSRRGWDLLFFATLINVGYAMVALFMRDHGVGSFLGSLISSAVSFYLLYQVRGKYTKAA